ncbi:hypothetical protein ElyMa_002086800 [Elysia marginata]|uniref:CTCK domain-containing protein n=1 Tax=Elysia marginata TaxID=1093978 RepID=A0AAV4FE52_9GAST|nr:hypothetical protein ElyMa_002086800 [Elysia marginata]
MGYVQCSGHTQRRLRTDAEVLVPNYQDKLLQWVVTLLAVAITFGQGAEPAIDLGSSGPAPFSREPRIVVTPGPPASSGPLPIFRKPSSPLDSFPSSETTPSDNGSNQPTQAPASSLSGNNAYQNQPQTGNIDNSISIVSATNKTPIVEDPDNPLILNSNDIFKNVPNLVGKGQVKDDVNTDRIGIKRPGNTERTNLLEIGNPSGNINTVLSNKDKMPEQSVQILNNAGSIGSTSSRKTNFGSGSTEANLKNAIPQGNRLINADSGQTLLDFQPDRTSLYVSVPRPLQVSPAPVCTFPQKFGQDQFELSTSEFGFPKSIVQQALKDSVAEAVLNLLTDIMYEGVMATQVSGYPRRGHTLIKNGLQQDQSLFGSRNIIGLATRAQKAVRPLSSPFGDIDSSFQQGDVGASDNEFRLTSGFGESSQNQNYGNEGSPRASDSKNKNVSGTSVNSQEQYNETQGSAAQEKGSNNRSHVESQGRDEITRSLLSPSPAPTFKSRMSSLPATDFGGFETFNENSPFLQPTGRRRSLLQGGDLNRDGNNIDRLFPPKTSDMFLDSPPSPVGGDAGDAPFISYNDIRLSKNGDSPFSFDSKSLFGSLPSSPFRSSFSGGSNQGSSFSPSLGGGNVGSGNQRGFSSFATSDFDAPGGLFTIGSKNDNRDPSQTVSNQGKTNSRFEFPRMLSRKKRQLRGNPDEKRVKPTCSPTYKLLRQYKNYNAACFVVMPESQGVYFAECSNSPCSGCRFEGGASRCMAERVPMWVWSYCEAGPNKGKVMPDRVQVAMTCSCKTTLCKSALNGR